MASKPYDLAVGRQSTYGRRVASASLSDFWGVAPAARGVHFHIIEYGDSAQMNEMIRKLLHVGCSTERNKCDMLALASDAE